MGFRLVQELSRDGVPVAVACRFLKVSTSGYYDWRDRSPSARALADAELTATIRRIHADSRATYGAPRVLAELRLGLGVHVARKRVARLMRADGLVGVSHRRKRRGWKPDTATHEDLVKRQFESPRRVRRLDSLEGSVSWHDPTSIRASFVSAQSAWSPRCGLTIPAST
ncbi:MAG: IS3 family transposase, partial [Actinobacteria bacterium]|nr:IS3 family transposase [Actinomycetota bacterium]MBU1609671.1 IS3 family transposase [Actinomycetota bacterium]